MSLPFIIPGKDGKPQFIGHEDPNNPPVQDTGSKMECPVCHNMVDYLVGEDTNDGGIRACEADWKPSKKGVQYVETRTTEPEII